MNLEVVSNNNPTQPNAEVKKHSFRTAELVAALGMPCGMIKFLPETSEDI